MKKYAFWKVFKALSAVGTAGAAAVYMHRNDWDTSSIGVVRFGRAAFAAGVVAADYKHSLFRVDSESDEYNEIIKKVHLRSAVRLRSMCCSNGGTFIKVGQHIGALDYLLPAEYVSVFKVLHSRAPESSMEDMLFVLRTELGREPDEIFKEMEPDPIGAASIAQVYKAKLIETDEIVAVKVQHKRVKAHSFVDMKSMEYLVKMMRWLFPEFKFKWLVREMKKNLPLELDFVVEAKNAEHVSKMFQQFAYLKVPKVFWKYTTDRVLTMEYCEGCQVDDVAYMKKHNIDTYTVLRYLGRLYSEMIFSQGYVHCDPHPGNVLVHQDSKNGVVLTLLDHGLYTVLNEDFRLNYSKLWMSLLSADLEGIRQGSKDLGCESMYGMLACMLTARSWDAVKSGIKTEPVSSAEAVAVRTHAVQYMVQITEILNSVPRQMILLLKTNDLLRGIEHTLTDGKLVGTAFLSITRACVNATYNYEINRCKSGWWCWLKYSILKSFFLFRLSVYEKFLSVLQFLRIRDAF